MRMRTMPLSAALGLGLLLGGCATQEASRTNANIAVSQQAIADAVAADANRFANGELQSARHELDQASAAVNNNDYDTADLLAAEAATDAALARAKASSTKAQVAANSLQESLRTLQQELGRTQQ
jgi:hypothetical protein